jgi:hypothetical protein
LVLVGTVTAVRDLGAPKHADQFPQLMLQCTEITANVETQLKGELPGGIVRFYYYILSKLSSADLGPPKYIPIVGQRRMFFLTSEGALVRSIGDVRDYTLRVSTGYHDRRVLDSLPFGQRAALVLLTPGQGYSPGEFAKNLDVGVYVSDRLNSTAYTDSLLDSLRGVEDAEVRRTVDQLIADRAWNKKQRGH